MLSQAVMKFAGDPLALGFLRGQNLLRESALHCLPFVVLYSAKPPHEHEGADQRCGSQAPEPKRLVIARPHSDAQLFHVVAPVPETIGAGDQESIAAGRQVRVVSGPAVSRL